jgi:hypothetical protein
MKKPKREILEVTVSYQFPDSQLWSRTFHVRVSNNAQEYRENVTRTRREALEYGLAFEKLGATMEIDDIREVLPEDVQEAQERLAAIPPEVMAEQVALADEVIEEILEEERNDQ